MTAGAAHQNHVGNGRFFPFVIPGAIEDLGWGAQWPVLFAEEARLGYSAM